MLHPGLMLFLTSRVGGVLLTIFWWLLAIVGGAIVLAFLIAFAVGFWKGVAGQKDLNQTRAQYEKEASADRENTRLAWDLARVTLEQYFNRNLQQVNMIFYAAVVAMGAGFGLILWGTFLAIEHRERDLAPLLTALSGVITEFISVTLMVIYKSTLQQAATYMKILEKINTVGMAVQIVETISPTDATYTQTRATMAKMLLEQFKSEAPVAVKGSVATK